MKTPELQTTELQTTELQTTGRSIDVAWIERANSDMLMPEPDFLETHPTP
jgi:hypothetical protein